MAADICTKAFANREQWQQACELVNVMDPKDLKDVIVRRAAIFQALRHDQKWHPINKKPQSGSSNTNRNWIKEQAQW